MTGEEQRARGRRPGVILIGASTGGTRLLPGMLASLPRLQAAVVIVQHMPDFITRSFALSLQKASVMPVQIVESGDVLVAGGVFLCPGGRHCELAENQRLMLHDGPKVNYVKPSVDVAMLSVRPAPALPGLCAVILTGMGRDGAEGLAHIKRLGGLTLAQEESSCAVFGMPKMAIGTGKVDQVLVPQAIVEVLAVRFG